MTDADRDTDIAVDDLKAGIARGRRNAFLVNMLGVGIAVAAVVVAGYYSLGEVGEAEQQVAIVAQARDEAEQQVAIVAQARDEAERQVAVVAEARDEAKMAADEANRKFAEAQNAVQGRIPKSSVKMRKLLSAMSSFFSTLTPMPLSSIRPTIKAAPYRLAKGTTFSKRSRPSSRLIELRMALP